jgi:two-component system, cell cycle sensor histidine kinase and response regulator CckA
VSGESSLETEDRLRAELAAQRELLTGHERAARDSASRLEMVEAELRQRQEEVARLHRDLREREERTRVLVDASHDAVVTMDAQGRVTGWNAQAEVLFGWSALEVLGRRLSSFLIPPQHREAHERGLQTFLATGAGPVLNRRIETTALRRDGREFPVELSISPAGAGDTYVFGAFIRDLTARKEADAALHRQTALVKLLQEVATAANLAPNTEQALQTGVDEVCAYTGWPVGHAYVLAGDGTGDLLPTRIWHFDQPQRFERFRLATEETRLPSGVGLPGRVLATGHATWLMDVTRDSNFPRLRAASDLGVRAGFAFPVLAGSSVVAVLEFFSSEAAEPDEPLLQAMAHIGTQLGRVFERQRAEEELRQAKQAADEASRAKSAFLASMALPF